MSRPLLNFNQVRPEAQKAIESFHAEVIRQVTEAIQSENVVVIGMSQNPFVKKARKSLEASGIKHRYLEFGSYFSHWKERLAIKLWSGWPTFPQVFVQGKLIGGYSELAQVLTKGELKA